MARPAIPQRKPKPDYEDTPAMKAIEHGMAVIHSDFGGGSFARVGERLRGAGEAIRAGYRKIKKFVGK